MILTADICRAAAAALPLQGFRQPGLSRYTCDHLYVCSCRAQPGRDIDRPIVEMVWGDLARQLCGGQLPSWWGKFDPYVYVAEHQQARYALLITAANYLETQHVPV